MNLISIGPVSGSMPEPLLPHADEVADGLFVGDWRAPVQITAARRFSGVVSVTPFLPSIGCPGIASLHIVADDCASASLRERFCEAAAFIADKLKTGRVLVHCQAGRSRSATVALAYLLRHPPPGTRSFEAIVALVRSKRAVFPVDGFIEELICEAEALHLPLRADGCEHWPALATEAQVAAGRLTAVEAHRSNLLRWQKRQDALAMFSTVDCEADALLGNGFPPTETAVALVRGACEGPGLGARSRAALVELVTRLLQRAAASLGDSATLGNELERSCLRHLLADEAQASLLHADPHAAESVGSALGEWAAADLLGDSALAAAKRVWPAAGDAAARCCELAAAPGAAPTATHQLHQHIMAEQCGYSIPADLLEPPSAEELQRAAAVLQSGKFVPRRLRAAVAMGASATAGS